MVVFFLPVHTPTSLKMGEVMTSDTCEQARAYVTCIWCIYFCLVTGFCLYETTPTELPVKLILVINAGYAWTLE